MEKEIRLMTDNELLGELKKVGDVEARFNNLQLGMKVL